MKKTNPLSISDIEKIAYIIRRIFKISNDEAFPIFDILEFFYEKGALTIQYLDNDDPIFEKDTPAKYNPIDNFIYLKTSVLEEIENCEYRSNFTLAHEFFHFIQFHVLKFEFEEVDKCLSYEDPEWQANEFAGQLLIPKTYLEAVDYDPKLIAEKFKVSEICAVTRRLKFKKRQETYYE